MVAFGHTALGASIGTATYLTYQNDLTSGLITAGSLGFIFHYIADFIPHGHFFKTSEFRQKIKYVLIFDVFLSLLIFSITSMISSPSNEKLFYVLFGIGGSQLPDILDGLLTIGILPKRGLLLKEYLFHEWVHWHGKGDNGLPLGLRDIWQVTLVLVSIFLVYYSR